jgi:hypothetical protein
MSVISTTRATERLSRKLQRAGINQWVARTSGDAWGKYLLFQVGGKCVAGAGWSLREAEAFVNHLIEYKDYEEQPPFQWLG